MKMCVKCILSYILYKMLKSNRGYWIMTEIFVKLHGGRDYCP